MRNSIATYLRYIKYLNVGAPLSNVSSEQSGFVSGEGESQTEEEIDEFNNFTYERDLQSALIAEIPRLFEGYKIYGTGLEGVEYSLDGKRIDVLLEHEERNDLLVIELKAGIADYKVFGQMSMYIGVLSKRIPGANISGVIIAGESLGEVFFEPLQQGVDLIPENFRFSFRQPETTRVVGVIEVVQVAPVVRLMVPFKVFFFLEQLGDVSFYR